MLYSQCIECGRFEESDGSPWAPREVVVLPKEAAVAVKLAGKVEDGLCAQCFKKLLNQHFPNNKVKV